MQKCTLFHLFKSVYHGCSTVEYYFEVRNTNKLIARIHHDVSNKKIWSVLNRWAVDIFKVLSITKLENSFEPLTDIGNPFHGSLLLFFIIVYVHNSEIHVLNFFFLSILLLTFIESILKNVNDVVCLLFLSNESYTDFFKLKLQWYYWNLHFFCCDVI